MRIRDWSSDVCSSERIQPPRQVRDHGGRVSANGAPRQGKRTGGELFGVAAAAEPLRRCRALSAMELNAPTLVHSIDLDLLARLGGAAVLGLMLGLDREMRGQDRKSVV